MFNIHKETNNGPYILVLGIIVRYFTVLYIFIIEHFIKCFLNFLLSTIVGQVFCFLPLLFSNHIQKAQKEWAKRTLIRSLIKLDIVLHWAFHYELRAVTLWSDHHRVLIPALPFTNYLLESEW